MDYYEFLGLEPKLALDRTALRKRFYALSRQWHPDRFSGRPPAEQQLALDNTALLNDALRTLRDPVLRAEYVLKLHGFEIGEQRSSDVPVELLEEVFELNMALEEIRGGDASARGQLQQAVARFGAMRDDLDEQLSGLFARYDSTQDRAVLAEIRGLLNRRKYFTNLLREAESEIENVDVPNCFRRPKEEAGGGD